jgi:hypothetical protein
LRSTEYDWKMPPAPLLNGHVLDPEQGATLLRGTLESVFPSTRVGGRNKAESISGRQRISPSLELRRRDATLTKPERLTRTNGLDSDSAVSKGGTDDPEVECYAIPLASTSGEVLEQKDGVIVRGRGLKLKTSVFSVDDSDTGPEEEDVSHCSALRPAAARGCFPRWKRPQTATQEERRLTLRTKMCQDCLRSHSSVRSRQWDWC